MRFRGITGVRLACFDFDGPLCSLFGRADVSSLPDEIRACFGSSELDPELLDCGNPHEILQRVAVGGRASEAALRTAAKLLEAAEVAAAESARETEGAAALVAAWASRTRTAVVSNNSAVAIRQYLSAHQLDFGDLIFGREEDRPDLMKPDPSGLHRAMAAVGCADPAACLLLGDSVADAQAARKAEMRFVGYVPQGRPRGGQRVAELYAEGAEFVVRHVADLLRELE